MKKFFSKKMLSLLLMIAMVLPLGVPIYAADGPEDEPLVVTITHQSDASDINHINIHSYNQVQTGGWNADPGYSECFMPDGDYEPSDVSWMILYPGEDNPGHKITTLVWRAVKHETFDIDFTFAVSDSPDGPWENFTHYTKSQRDLSSLGAYAWFRGIYTITEINSKYIKITWPVDFDDKINFPDGWSWRCLGSGFDLTSTNDPELPPAFGRAKGDCSKLVDRNIVESGNLIVGDSPVGLYPETNSNGTGNTYVVFAAPAGCKITNLELTGFGTDANFPDFGFSVSNVFVEDEFLTFAGNTTVNPGDRPNTKIYGAAGLNSRYVKVTWPYNYGEAFSMAMVDYYFEYTNRTVLEPVVIPKEPPAYPDVYNISLTGELQQTITGWGLYYGEADENDNRKLLQDAVFKDMGITNYRIAIPYECAGPDKTIIYEELDRVANTVRLAADVYGIDKYLLSVWTPPPEFKSNGSYLGTGNAYLLPAHEQDYCDYVVKCLDYIIKEKGLPAPACFDLQNEPENAAPYASCFYTPAQYIRVTKMMRRTLDEAGYQDIPLLAIGDVYLRNVKFFGGRNFPNFASDPEFNAAVPIVAVHAYVHPGWTKDSDVSDWRNGLDLYPEKEAWQTEFCTGAGLPSATMMTKTTDLAKVLSANMVHGRINNWMWWIAHRPSYEINVSGQEALLAGNGVTRLDKSMQYHLLSLIYNNAVEGSKVALLETDDPEIVTRIGERIDMCAWRNDNADIVLLANTRKSTNRYYRFNNLNGKSAAVYYFDEEISMNGAGFTPNNFAPKVLPARNLVDGSIVVEVPNNTIIVVVTSDNAAPPEVNIDITPELSYLWYSDKYASRVDSFDLIVETDTPAAVLINNLPALEISDRFYSIPVILSPGENIFTITATDMNTGMSGNITVTIIYRPDFVNLEITSAPRSVNYTNYTIEGKMNTSGSVLISVNDGSPVSVTVNPADYSFAYYLTLGQGRNKIKLVGVDENNNQSADVLVFVECDSIAPVITLDSYNPLNNDGEFVISGSVSKNAELTINGAAVNFITGNDFAHKFRLAEGENEFVIFALDSFFNEATEIINVTFETDNTTPVVTEGVTYSKKTDNPVVVDGVLSEDDWKINNKTAKILMGTPNNIVNFGTLWDDEYLYVGVKVVDTGLFFDAGQVYNNDCVEVFVNGDGQRGGSYNNSSPASTDHQLSIGFTDGSVPYTNPSIKTGVLTGWNKTDDGFTAEMAVPWAILGVEPGTGVTIGFDVGNIDKDKPGPREHNLTWNGTGDNWQSTADYGLLVLYENCDDHIWSDWTITMPATETTDGVRTRICAVCLERETEIIPATGGSVTLVNAGGAKFVSITETFKNSRVWVLTFDADVLYSDGSGDVVRYSINLNGNNANLDGKYEFADYHELAGYVLVYDIKGNGSNIKAFEIIPK